MRNKIFFLMISCCLMACKKNHPAPPPQPPETDVSGSIYGSQFVYKSAKEQYTKYGYGDYKPEDLFAIYLSANAEDDCASPNSNFLVRLSVPRKIGKFTGNDVYVLVNDPNSHASALFSTGAAIEIEITAITENKVTGRVAISSAAYQTVLNGVFESVSCH